MPTSAAGRLAPGRQQEGRGSSQADRVIRARSCRRSRRRRSRGRCRRRARAISMRGVLRVRRVPREQGGLAVGPAPRSQRPSPGGDPATAPTRRESAPPRRDRASPACRGRPRATPRAARAGLAGAWSSVRNRADKSGWAARAIDSGILLLRAGRDVGRRRTCPNAGPHRCGRTGCGKLAADARQCTDVPLSPYVQLEYTTALPRSVGTRPGTRVPAVTPCWPASFCRNMRSSARRAGVGLEPAARLCPMIRGGRMPPPREQLT